MKRLLLFPLVLILLTAACSSPAGDRTEPKAAASSQNAAVPSQELTVYAAASLTDAFTQIGQDFEASQPGVTVKLNFAGSQTLRTQIEHGAQVDIFASANATEMNALVTSEFVGEDSPRIFLHNQLVVIMPAENFAGISRLEDLSKSGLKLVLAAKEVPVGNYTLQVIDKLDQAIGNGYKEKVLANVASYENDVKQVVAKVQLGEADAGFVYASDMVAAPKLQKLDIPVEQNVVASYPIAVLSQSKDPKLAQAFVSYVLSPAGQSVLEEWGFLPVQ